MNSNSFGGLSKETPVALSYKDLAKEVVSRLHIRLSSRITSDEWKCFCPYHEDKHPSMYINPDKFIYHCFQCGASGSLHQLYYSLMGSQLLADLKIANDPFSLFAYFNKGYEAEEIPTLEASIDIQITSGEILPAETSSVADRKSVV